MFNECLYTFQGGGSRIFITSGYTSKELPFLWRLTQILQPCLMYYFNTNKPATFLLQNTSSIRKPQAISGGALLHAPFP